MMDYHPFSCKKCCLFLLIIIILLVIISGFLTIIIIFVLNPRKPIFLFQSVNIASYKFDDSDSNSDSDLSTVFVSSVASVTIMSQNANIFGFRFDFSRLKILNYGLVVGMIRIPEFYQPARSYNVSIKIDVLVQRLDISRIMAGAETRNLTIKVVGDVGVRLRLVQIKLPKIKVGLDCDVEVDWRSLISANEISSLKAIKNRIDELDSSSQAFSKKCSIAFYL